VQLASSERARSASAAHERPWRCQLEFNFHEDEKAQYQPDYMAGAYSGGQATSKGEPKKKRRVP